MGSDGSAEFENVKIRGAIQASVFQKSVQSAFAGSMFCGKSAGTLSAALVIDNGTIPFANTAHVIVSAPPTGGWLFDTGDIVRIKAQYSGGVGDTWLTLTRTATTNEYTATVNYGSKNLTYPAGTAVVDYGPSGSGFFGVAADGTHGAGAAWVLATHGGQPWLGVGVANGITQQVYAGTDGKLYAGAGNVTLDANGISLAWGTGSANKISWLNNGFAQNSIASYPFGLKSCVDVSAQGDAVHTHSTVSLTAMPSGGVTVGLAVDSSSGVTIVGAGLNVGTVASPQSATIKSGLNVGAATAAPAGAVYLDNRVHFTGSIANPGTSARGMWLSATNGLILQGSGSTYDFVLANNAGADVIEVPTGTTNVNVNGGLNVGTTGAAAGAIKASSDITAAGRLYGTCGYSSYVADGLFGATATPSYISKPDSYTGPNKLLFGYSDAGSGQYVPRVGFLAVAATAPGNQTAAKASIGLEPISGDFTIRGGSANAEHVRILNASGKLGVGISPSEMIHSSAKVRADTVFNVYGTDGIGTVAVPVTFSPIVGLQYIANPSPPPEDHIIQYCTQTITMIGGIVTAKSAVSAWADLCHVP
jgi:hypothetical protein